MLDISTMDKIDIRGMYKVYDEWPQIAKDAYDSTYDPMEYRDIDHVVFAGMGGSGAIGDLFSSLLSKSNIHVSIVKGYLLPKTVNKNTLLVATSVSGNTVETLAALNSATKTDCKIICFSSGGMMEQFCAKNNLDYRKIPQTHSPRASYIRYIYSIIGTLNYVIPINKESILESISKLKEMTNISSSNLSETNPALDLARWISGIPVIYYPHGLQSAAIRFKNSMHENAKSHAIAEDVIEACHNEVSSWEKPSNAKPILLEGQDDFIKTKERWQIIREYFKKNDIDYKEVFSVSGNILSKLTCMTYLLDYTSIYVAILQEIDPSPLTSLNFIKEKLRSYSI